MKVEYHINSIESIIMEHEGFEPQSTTMSAIRNQLDSLIKEVKGDVSRYTEARVSEIIDRGFLFAVGGE